MQQAILVVGGGTAGTQTAIETMSLGYRVTLIEGSDRMGGKPGYAGLSERDYASLLHGVQVLKQAHLTELTGHVGSFQAAIGTPDGETQLECGAIAICVGSATPRLSSGPSDPRVVPIWEVRDCMRALPRREQRKPVGLVLDKDIEETKASTDWALRLTIDLRADYGCEVYLCCRELRVSALPLEALYDEARGARFTIVRYDGSLRLDPNENEVLITARDVVLGEDIRFGCGLVGVSPYGLSASSDRELAALAGVDTDALGQMQDNNIHLFPGLTNRPGIFVVGACRGQHYAPQVVTDAKATALAIHSLLRRGHLDVELSQPVVDADKCALCLTCVRSCPHRAMVVNESKKAAEGLPEACQKCGICVAECPAKAIELPGFPPVKSLVQQGAG